MRPPPRGWNGIDRDNAVPVGLTIIIAALVGLCIWMVLIWGLVQLLA